MTTLQQCRELELSALAAATAYYKSEPREVAHLHDLMVKARTEYLYTCAKYVEEQVALSQVM